MCCSDVNTKELTLCLMFTSANITLCSSDQVTMVSWHQRPSQCTQMLLIAVMFHCEYTWVSSGKDMTLLTFAGMWIQIAALNRIWSQSCLRRGAPWLRPFRYLAKARNCSKTALVTCIRDAWETFMRFLFIKPTSDSKYLYELNIKPTSEAWRHCLALQLN